MHPAIAELGFKALDGGHRFLVRGTDQGQGKGPQGKVIEAAPVLGNVVVLSFRNGGRQDVDLPRVETHTAVQGRRVLVAGIDVWQENLGRGRFHDQIGR